MGSSWKSKCINPFNKDIHPFCKDLFDFPTTCKNAFPLVPDGAKVCGTCRRQIYKRKTDLPASDAKKANVNCCDEYHKAGVAVLEQIKRTFSNATSKQDRIQLLTLAPEFWSRNDLMREFSCTEWEARKAKDLVTKNGIFSIPEKKRGKVLPAETVNLVKNFFEKDDISRIMPGLKDCLSVKQENGKREQVQKRLLLGNLNEIYCLFQKDYEDVKISLTKFMQLRPTHCVLAGSSGTHNVCVCVHHENFKLMLEATDLENMTKDTQLPLKTYHDCIQAIVCKNPRDECYLGDCLDCPNTSILRDHLLDCFEKKNISQIQFESWFQTDRCTIGSISQNVYDFLNTLCEKLMKLKTHDFYAKKQSLYVNDLKKNLQEGEFIVCFDFAENYAFVVQNSTQSFHWNNNQATIFTVVVYYKENNEIKHVSIAVISDNLNHDTVAVYEYQKIVILYLKSNFTVKKIYYLTDGAGQHFKNKNNMQNLLFHEKDFGILAEWHFYATAHGKGACDGIGANLKRGARRASLQLSSKNRILTAKDLYKWAINYCKETKVFYSSKDSYEKTVLELKPRLDKAKAIPGTLQYHAFIPTNQNILKLKKISSSNQHQIFSQKVVTKREKNASKKPVTKSKKIAKTKTTTRDSGSSLKTKKTNKNSKKIIKTS